MNLLVKGLRVKTYLISLSIYEL